MVRVTSTLEQPGSPDQILDRPDIAIDEAGVIHVAYRRLRPGTDEWEVIYGRSADCGRSWSDRAIAQVATGRPSIRAWGGLILLAWTDGRTVELASSIDQGRSWDPPVRIYASPAGRTWGPDVAVTGTGWAVVAFCEDDRVLAARGPVRGPFTEPAILGSGGWAPVVAASASGEVLAAWNSDPGRSPTFGIGIWISRSTDAGRTWQAARLLCAAAGCAFGIPDLAVEGNSVALSYQRYAQGKPPVLEVRRSSDAGRTWARSLRVTSLPPLSLGAAVAFQGPDRLTVAWAEPAAAGYRLLATNSVGGGAAFRRPEPVTTRILRSSPRLASGGGFLAYAWLGDDEPGPGRLVCHVDSGRP